MKLPIETYKDLNIMTHPATVADTPEMVQWRNIRKVVRTLADFCFGEAGTNGSVTYETARVALINSLTAKDGATIELEPLPSATAPSAEEMARFCPGCGSVGAVDDKYRDCCPDGGDARMIPKSLADKCNGLFRAALAGIDGRAAAPVGADKAAAIPTWQDRSKYDARSALTLMLDEIRDLRAARAAGAPAETAKAVDALRNIRDVAYFDSSPSGKAYYAKAENALAAIECRDAAPQIDATTATTEQWVRACSEIINRCVGPDMYKNAMEMLEVATRAAMGALPPAGSEKGGA